MTRIVPGKSKGPEFTAGQTFTGGDVCRLQHMGRNLIYVQDEAAPDGEWIHENEAALAFARRMAGPGVMHTETPKEGKIDFYAGHSGLLSIDRAALTRFNLVPDVMCASRQGDCLVEKGRIVAGTRAIPLFLSRANFSRALSVLGESPLFEVLPLRKAKVGVLVTGTEIFQGLIEDKFEPVIRSKAEALGSAMVGADSARRPQCHRRRRGPAPEERVRSHRDHGRAFRGPRGRDAQGPPRRRSDEHALRRAHPPRGHDPDRRIGQAQVLGVPACALFHKTTGLDLLLLLPRLPLPELQRLHLPQMPLREVSSGGACAATARRETDHPAGAGVYGRRLPLPELQRLHLSQVPLRQVSSSVSSILSPSWKRSERSSTSPWASCS
jgi:formylmethanofuran dehydrogenase subunit E